MTNPPKTPPLWIYSAMRSPYKPPSKIKISLFDVHLQIIANFAFETTYKRHKRHKHTNKRAKKSDDD